MRRLPGLLLATTVLTAACDTRVTLDERSEELKACAFDGAASSLFPVGPTEPRLFRAGEPVQLRVSTVGCGGCPEQVDATCSVAVVGQELRLDVDFSWVESSGECVLICAPISTTCRTTPLPAGDYTLVMGTRTTTLTVGSSTLTDPCIGQAPLQ